MSDLIKDIQPDFSHNSNFVEKSNESSVRFGANTQILEVELNELQDIQNKAKEDLIRDSIPSGFIVPPTLNMIGTTENINKLRINNTPIAYVNGMRIEIPSSTFIDIGEPPEKGMREDLVFLEVWKEVVDGNSTLTLNGGEGLGKLPNKIIDPRMGEETSRRVVNRWRIRCIQDMNFDFRGNVADTIGNCPNLYIGWNDSNRFTKAYAKGANPSLSLPDKIVGIEVFRGASSTWNGVVSKDSCLWVAGVKGDTSSINRYKTVDGLVYAIPMFKLIRRPSTGVLKGDYMSLAPLSDYDKVQNILAEEKVSGFKAGDVTLELEGKTLLNLIDGNPYFSGNPSEIMSTDSINSGKGIKVKRTKAGTMDYMYIAVPIKLDLIKYNTDYTVVFKGSGRVALDSAYINFMEGNATNSLAGTRFKRIEGLNVVRFKTTSDTSTLKNTQVLYMGITNSELPNINDEMTFTDFIVLEGNMPDSLIPKIFSGIQSAGEDRVAFKKFLSYKTTVTNGTADGSIATFNYKPETNLVQFVPVGSDGKEIIDTNMAYALKINNGANTLTWKETVNPKVLTDVEREQIDTVNIYCNTAVKTNNIIGFNIYDGYCIRLKSEIDENRETLLDVNLKEPLRQIPDGTKDTVEVNGVVNRRLARKVLDNTITWTAYPDQNNTDVLCFYSEPIPNLVRSRNFLCNRFNVGAYWDLNIEVITTDNIYNTERFFLKIAKSKLETQDVEGLKKWLQTNPIEVIYPIKVSEPLNSLPNGVSDLDDGMGTITRNVKQATYNGSENWFQAGTQFSGTYSAYLDIAGGLNGLPNLVKVETLNMLSDYSTNEEGYYALDSSSYSTLRLIIRLNSSRLTSQDIRGFKDYLKANPIKVSYQLEIPTIETYTTERAEFVGDLLFNNCNADIVCENNIIPKINLSHKANAKVDLYKDYTKVTTDNYIEPKITVKDQVGIGSVELTPSEDEKNVPVKFEGITYSNISNINFRDRNQFSTFSRAMSLEDGYLVFNRTEGTGEYVNAFTNKFDLVKPNTTYTLIVEVVENTLSEDYSITSILNDDTPFNQFWSLGAGKVGVVKYKLTTKADISNSVLGIRSYANRNTTGKLKFRYYMLEGDYTNVDVPPYFEGTISVAEDEAINTISRGKNLFNQEAYTLVDGYYTSDWDYTTPKYKVKLKPNTNYRLSFTKNPNRSSWISIVLIVDGKTIYEGNNESKDYNKTFTTPSGKEIYLVVTRNTPSDTMSIKDIMLSEGTEKIPFEPFKANRKSYSLPIDGLKGLPNGVCDSIEQREEESYLVQRVGKKIFNGSDNEKINLSGHQAEGFLSVTLFEKSVVNEGELICSHFIKSNRTWQSDYLNEGIQTVKYSSNEGYFIIKIKQSKLSIATPSGFREWLKDNPITVYYELAEPIVTQLNSNLVTEKERTTFALEGQVGYKRTDEGGVLAESLLLTQNLNPNWHQVGEVRKYKYTLNKGSILDLLDVPLVPGTQLGTADSLSCPYKMKVIKVLPNSECLVKNIGKNAVGGQSENFYAPQFLSARVFRDDIDEIYPRVSLTGWDYNQLLEETLLKILK